MLLFSKKLGSVFCNNMVIASLMAKFITFTIIIQSNLWVDLFVMLPNEKLYLFAKKENIFVPCNTMPEYFRRKAIIVTHLFFFLYSVLVERTIYNMNIIHEVKDFNNLQLNQILPITIRFCYFMQNIIRKFVCSKTIINFSNKQSIRALWFLITRKERKCIIDFLF